MEIIIEESKIYLSYTLIKSYGIGDNTIEGWKKRKNGEYLKRGNKSFILYNSIPSPSRKKIPLKEMLAEIKLEQQKNDYLVKKAQKEDKILMASKHLEFALSERYIDFQKFYIKYTSQNKKIQELAKGHAVLDAVLKLKESKEPKYTIKEVFELFKAIQLTRPKIENYSYLDRVLNSIKKTGIEEYLKPKARKKRYKLTDRHIYLIRALYADARKLSTRAISESLDIICQEEGLGLVKHETVKGYLKNKEVQNELALFRHGKKYFNEQITPYLKLKAPEFALDQVQMDGTRFQFMFLKPDDSIGFLTVFAIMDVYSCKIIGHSVSETEDRYMALEALKMACVFTGFLPYEIVSDNFSSLKTDEFKSLIERTEILGVHWRTSKVGNPQERKQERYWGVFQDLVCKKEIGYIGEGILSKRKDARPSPELIDKYSEKRYLRDKSGTVLLIATLINEYNNKSFKGRVSPNDKYSNSDKKNAIKLDPHQISLLFWHSKELEVKRSMIRMNVKKVEYTYVIMNNALGIALTNSKVLVKYDERDLSEIHLFDLKTEGFLCICKQQRIAQVSQAGQTERDINIIKGHSSHVKSLNSYVVEKAIQERKSNEKIHKGIPFEALSKATSRKADIVVAEELALINYTKNVHGIDESLIKPVEAVPVHELNPLISDKIKSKKDKSKGSYYVEVVGDLQIIEKK